MHSIIVYLVGMCYHNYNYFMAVTEIFHFLFCFVTGALTLVFFTAVLVGAEYREQSNRLS